MPAPNTARPAHRGSGDRSREVLAGEQNGIRNSDSGCHAQGGAEATTIIATLRKNAREDLRVSLDRLNGHDLISLRVWFDVDDDGQRPGKAGVALRIQLLPQLIAALQLAEAEAVRHGLIGVGR